MFAYHHLDQRLSGNAFLKESKEMVFHINCCKKVVRFDSYVLIFYKCIKNRNRNLLFAPYDFQCGVQG